MDRRLRVAVLFATIAGIALAGCGESGPTKQDVRQARQAGYRAGLLDGTNRARKSLARAYSQGATDALGAAQFTPGQWYAVQFESDRTGFVGVSVFSTLSPDDLFSVCTDDPSTICDYGAATNLLSGVEPSYTGDDSAAATPIPGTDLGSPTTEEFGSGNGYVVTCNDGTLSDSGGIQGACSYHGGVSP